MKPSGLSSWQFLALSQIQASGPASLFLFAAEILMTIIPFCGCLPSISYPLIYSSPSPYTVLWLKARTSMSNSSRLCSATCCRDLGQPLHSFISLVVHSFFEQLRVQCCSVPVIYSFSTSL